MSKSTITKRIIGTGAAVAVSAGVGLAVSATPAHADVWDNVAKCESGGNWGISTGNGFSGGLQFTSSTWRANGGKGSASSASKSEQKRVAKNVLKTQGPGAWPVCGAKAGLTRSNGGAASGSGSSYSSSTKRSYSSSKSYSSHRSYSSQKSYSTTKSYSAQKSNSYTPKRSSGYTAPANTGYTAKRASGHVLTVKSGDTLAKIAAQKGIKGGWQSLYRMNLNTVSNPNLILVGQTLHY